MSTVEHAGAPTPLGKSEPAPFRETTGDRALARG